MGRESWEIMPKRSMYRYQVEVKMYEKEWGCIIGRHGGHKLIRGISERFQRQRPANIFARRAPDGLASTLLLGSASGVRGFASSEATRARGSSATAGISPLRTRWCQKTTSPARKRSIGEWYTARGGVMGTRGGGDDERSEYGDCGSSKELEAELLRRREGDIGSREGISRWGRGEPEKCRTRCGGDVSGVG